MYEEYGGPKQGVPLPAAHSATRGAGEPAGFLSIDPTLDGALCLAAELLFGEAWAVRRNAEIWRDDGSRANGRLSTKISSEERMG